MCVALKSSILLSLLLVTHSPSIAFWVLAPFFMLDAVLNAGILIANNGFMIKNSPTENRTMYIAATQAVAGVVGGVTSIAAGWFLQSIAGRQWSLAGWVLSHYQIMFLASIALRWAAWGLTRYVHEPQARHTWDVVQELVRDMLDRLDIRSTTPESVQSDPAIPVQETVPVEPVTKGTIPAPHLRPVRSKSESRENGIRSRQMQKTS
jgi:hypothetical protein